MRQIRRAGKFKRDYKKLSLSERTLELLKEVIHQIANGEKLNEELYDHSLSGEWKGYCELHLKSDLLLIYKITQDELRLARIGSHSELFG